MTVSQQISVGKKNANLVEDNTFDSTQVVAFILHKAIPQKCLFLFFETHSLWAV